MWRVALADLRFRRRRFVIAILATAVVFAMTLLIVRGRPDAASTGPQHRRVVRGDRWFVGAGASGPFTTTTPIPAGGRGRGRGAGGVDRATPVVLFRTTVAEDGGPADVNVIATPPGGWVRAPARERPTAGGAGEVVVDDGARAWARARPSSWAATRWRSSERPSDVSYYFGTPTVYMGLADAQAPVLRLPAAGRPRSSSEGAPQGEVAGLRALTDDEVRADLRRPTRRSDQTIQFINVLLWLAAVGIVGLDRVPVGNRAGPRVRRDEGDGRRPTASLPRSGWRCRPSCCRRRGRRRRRRARAGCWRPGSRSPCRSRRQLRRSSSSSPSSSGSSPASRGLRRAVKVDPALAFGGG